MSGLEEAWKDKVVFLKKGTQEDDTVPMMEKLGFDGVPSVIVLDAKGVEVTRFLGVKSAAEIEAMLKKATGS